MVTEGGCVIEFWFCYALCMANAVVAWLNVLSWRKTDDPKDFAASIAWIGSAAYWLLRVVLSA